MLNERPFDNYGQRIDHYLVSVCNIQGAVVCDRVKFIKKSPQRRIAHVRVVVLFESVSATTILFCGL
jgi:hypothetical protein